MRILELVLHNYRQFDRKTIKYPRGLIGIIGANGTGKSHLQEALQFCLSGEVPGATKSALLRWGTSEGSASLKFNAGSKEYKVTRNLATATATLEIVGSDAKPIRGITKVNDLLFDILGIDKETFRQAVFARQSEIDDVLFTEPRIRALTLQKLCGIGEAAKIHEQLKQVVAKNEIIYDHTAELAAAEQDKANQKTALVEAQSKIACLDIPQENAVSISEAIESNRVIKASLERKEIVTTSLLEQIKMQDDLLLSLNNNSELLNSLPELNISSKIAELQDLKEKAYKYDTYTKSKAAAEAELNSLKDIPTLVKQVDMDRASVDNLTIKLSQIIAEAKPLDSLLLGLNNTAETEKFCPVCRSAISNIAELKASVISSIQKLKVEEELISQLRLKALDEHTHSSKELERVQIARATCTQQLNTATEVLNNLPTDLEDYTLYSANIIELEGMRKDVQDLTNTIAVQTERKKTLESTIHNLTEENLKLCKITKDKVIADILSTVTNLQNRLADYTEKTRQKANLEGQITQIAKVIKNLTSTISTIKQKQENIQNHVKALTVLHNVVDWFHYTKGPAQVAGKYLQVLANDVNKYLEIFSAPFVVLPDFNTLGFRVSFTDGRNMPEEAPPANVLSGGEKMMLAISFRLANHKLFADKLGLLSLDEPTVYLDSDNITNFCTVVEKLKVIVNSLDLQIIIATHESSVMPYFDTVISLN